MIHWTQRWYGIWLLNWFELLAALIVCLGCGLLAPLASRMQRIPLRIQLGVRKWPKEDQ